MSPAAYPPLKIRVLGSGTSMGVPVVGCHCPVCLSSDPRNKRLRSSIMIHVAGKNILIDCSIDFRQQMLNWPVQHIDAVLITHTHSDHINGLDDLRPFNYLQQGALPLYSRQYFLDDLQTRFSYAFNPFQKGGGVPQLDLRAVEPGEPFEAVEGVMVTPIEIMHGKLAIMGYRLGRFAYLTDCSGIPEHSEAQLQGLDLLIISALRHRPHSTHFNVQQSLEASERLGAKRVFFTHVADDLDHETTNRELPEWANLLYDGQELEVG